MACTHLIIWRVASVAGELIYRETARTQRIPCQKLYRQHVARRAFRQGFGIGSAGHYTVAPNISLRRGPALSMSRVCVLHICV
jgi:hypothetical protein